MKVKFEKIKVDMSPANTILTQLGVNPTGDVQSQATKIVWHRITRYMPYRSGALRKNKYIKSPTEIEVVADYAHYQYAGKVWVDPVTHAAGFLTANGWYSRKDVPKVETSRKLQYNKHLAPEAGANWDRRLVVAEGPAMQQDLQDYVNRRAGL